MCIRKSHPLLASAILVSACAGSASGEYPSLAIRDVERAEGNFEPVARQTLDVPEVGIDRTAPLGIQLSALLEQSRDAHASFIESQPAAEQRVASASGSGVGSDTWAAAQVALADLDSARSQAAIALGDLDILYTASAVQAEDIQSIATVRDQVVALISEEDAVLERLRAQIR